MKRFLLAFLIVFLGIMAGLAVLAASMFRNWPAWTALAALLAVWGLPVLYLAVRALGGWLGRRRYARKVLKRETGAAGSQGFSVLHQQWNHGLMALRPVNFGGRADPVTDLGWFLLLGPADSGKNEVIAESGLLNSLRTLGGDVEARESQRSGLDWYLLESSVILDLKGAVPESGRPAGDDDWKAFLELLQGSRRRQPLEGIVLTVGAELLNPRRADDLRALMELDRDRLNSYFSLLDQSPPVYLMFTKLGQKAYLGDGLRLLEQKGQPAGIMFDPGRPPDPYQIRSQIENRLRELFISCLDPENPEGLVPVLAAPAFLNNLERALA
ncbi:MAG: hypothetical protein LBK52_04580, partial [Deltaproteobacteria bacterium]|nr:hypothetical protein [Deltaproteobacteria bacterium]